MAGVEAVGALALLLLGDVVDRRRERRVPNIGFLVVGDIQQVPAFRIVSKASAG
jgi:hypothetical protein